MPWISQKKLNESREIIADLAKMLGITLMQRLREGEYVYLQNLISEHKEKQRLIKLAEEGSKGKN